MVPPDADVPPLPPVGLVVVPPVGVLPPAPFWTPSDDEHPTKVVEIAKKYRRDSVCMVKAFSAAIISDQCLAAKVFSSPAAGKFP
jgi:hypothetical protein